MSFSLFPPARARWILHRDEDLLVVDKPAGIPCQSPEPDEPDDLPHRLRLHLAAQAGGEAGPGRYLGIHQRLDRDTSGVIVYAARREANAGLARQFEGRLVTKVYRAVVTGFRGGDRVLRHRLSSMRDGRVEALAPTKRGGPRAREAITRVRVIDRRGGRALLELRIETGRTHQIRAQLAAEGAPVVGDPIYGGEPAERLMLHASSIAFVHPGRAEDVRFVAPDPAALGRALEGRDFVGVEDERGLAEVIERAIDRRFGLAAKLSRGGRPYALRLFHRHADGVPELALDLYHRHLVAHLYVDEERDREAALGPLLRALEPLGAEGVYVKHRPKVAQRASRSGLLEWAPAEPAIGSPAPSPLVIYEDGIPLRVHLDRGLSTGIFLDQRDNRRHLRAIASGTRVLNLFAYTCAFSLAAAIGGADETVSVDVSDAALREGEANFEGAEVATGQHAFVRADVFKALAAFAREGRVFDRIVVDPPTFSTTRQTRWTSQSAWEGLVESVMRVAAPGAILLLSSNDYRMNSARFRRFVHRGVERAGRTIASLRDVLPPRDFSPRTAGQAHLKCLWLMVD